MWLYNKVTFLPICQFLLVYNAWWDRNRLLSSIPQIYGGIQYIPQMHLLFHLQNLRVSEDHSD